jgi:hypothetical protein
MTLTYVVVVLVVVVLLYASFRVLGGGEPLPAQDYRTVLVRLAEFTAARADELRAALAASSQRPEPAAPADRRAADPAAEAAGAARKKLGGYLQQLSRLDVSAAEQERPALDAARIELEAAIEDLGWACRMVEAGVYADNPGIQEAVAVLHAHGDAGLATVRTILAAAPAALGEAQPLK